MPDDLLLLALFVLLYVSDSYFFLHKHSVAFRQGSGGRCQIILPSSNAGNRDRALHLLSLFPPLQPIYISSLLPVSCSETGLLSYVSQTLATLGRPKQPCQEIEYANVRAIGAEGTKLLINGEPFVSCRVPDQATLIAGTVGEIVTTSGQRASSILNKMIDSALDANNVARIVAEYRRTSRPLRVICNTIFFVFFLLFPVLARWHGLGVSLIVTLVLLAVLLPSLCVFFYSLHRRFSMGSRWDRIGCVIRFIICPPCAIRANDLISRSLIAKFHPVAVALALCDKPEASAFVRKMLRDLQNPLHQDLNGKLSLSIDEEWRKKMIAAVERTARQSGMESQELLEIPRKSDPSMVTVCPRCLAQFSARFDSCPDCLGIAPIAFPQGTNE